MPNWYSRDRWKGLNIKFDAIAILNFHMAVGRSVGKKETFIIDSGMRCSAKIQTLFSVNGFSDITADLVAINATI